MRRLRVAVQAWLDWRPPSGARTRLRGLLTALAELPESHAVEIHLLGTEDPDPVLHSLSVRHPHMHWHGVFVSRPGSLTRALDESRRLPALLHDLEVDVLDQSSLPVARLQVPVCLTLHDLRDLGPHARGMRRFAIHQTLEQAVRRAARIVVPTQAVSRELEERQPRTRDRILVVPPALEAASFRDARPVPGLPGPYFLHLGRPEPRKNLPFLIAAHRAARAEEDALPPLVLAGPGLAPSQRPISLARALGDAPTGVQWLESPDDSILPSLLAGACALVFPSTLEGFGMPALEALAAGVPILAPEGSVQADVAGPAALTLPLDDPGSWTRALLDLTRSPALQSKLRQQARLRSLDFDPCSAARAWMGAWRASAAAGSSHLLDTLA